jgi:hypothetical protein
MNIREKLNEFDEIFKEFYKKLTDDDTVPLEDSDYFYEKMVSIIKELKPYEEEVEEKYPQYENVFFDIEEYVIDKEEICRCCMNYHFDLLMDDINSSCIDNEDNQ